MWQTNIGVVIPSDLHLSHNAPIARSVDKDWYGCMERYINQLKKIQRKYKAIVVCPGDIFDKWNPPPELINFAIKHLPKMYAIPGQHDLPFHNLSDIKRSAYWTLVEAGTVVNIEWEMPIHLDNLVLHGFPWGTEIIPIDNKLVDSKIHLAVIHSYIWTGIYKYPNASDTKKIESYDYKLKGFTGAVFGDNHKGFLDTKKNIFNIGTFMRRKIDEKNYTPMVGLMNKKGKLLTHLLHVKEDKFMDTEDIPIMESSVELESLMEELKDLPDGLVNFREAVDNYLDNNHVHPKTRTLILKSLESK